jgi:hypothetical protein
MKNNIFSITLLITCFILSSLPCEAQLFRKNKNKKEAPAEKEKKDKDGIKKYSEVITKKAISDDGLFTVHKIKNDYYFEIPNELIGEEILVVSRISGFVKGLNFGGAGVKSKPQQVIRWQRKGDRILLRSVSYNSVADYDKPIYESVRNNNFEPVIMSFDIEALSKDSSGVVFKANPFFETDVPMISPMSNDQRKRFGISSLDKSRSFIDNIKSFPQNTEVRHIMTYKGNKLPDNQLTSTLSVEMNQSFIKLPEVPWQPRYYDGRVGYFSVSQTDYSSDAQRASSKRYITRWKLEPKDPVAYANGELVEPVKPIVYYIDPATPKEWIPYLKQGVNDWKAAFEEAGFKNAIMAKDAPTKEEDPDWSPEDVRYSVIRYISTDIQNAQGPHVHDPRTGEILESDIMWYHNVMNLLRNWFFIQTAAINPDARSVNFKTEVMGRLIRFVSAHEVGHTLGLPHNMGSSVAYPVDSLRSPSFTKKMGTAPSIMDYARFNYVAQPEDGDVGLMPDIGPYDKWSIEYGYRLNPTANTPEADRDITRQWIIDHADQAIYRYGQQQRRVIDPSSQTEDLGDDAMKASAYGIANLKRIVPNLIEWSSEDGENFDQLEELYNNVIGQYNRYMGHVTNNIGGVYEYRKSYDQDEVVFTHVKKEKQKRAMKFLNDYLFTTPEWLIDRNVLQRISNQGLMDKISNSQDRALVLLLNPKRLERVIENQSLNGNSAYGIGELFDDIENGIFSELKSNASISPYRRNLQRIYVNKIIKMLKMDDKDIQDTDVSAVLRAALFSTKTLLESSRKTDDLSKYHIDDLKERIRLFLEQ